jgi:PKD repeat protein
MAYNNLPCTNVQAVKPAVLSAMQAHSDGNQDCTINYGDQSAVRSLSVASGTFVTNETHGYPSLGLYPVTLTCTNQFGVTTGTATAPGVKSGVPYESYAKGVDVTVAATGVDSKSIQVLVDGSPTSNFVANASQLILSRSLFQTVGEHSVVLKQSATGLTLLAQVFEILQPVVDVLVTTESDGVELGQPTVIKLTVQHGDRMFVSLSYGDGQSELIYLASAPATVTRSHVYQALGPYPVTATVVNDVSSATAATVASIERKIVSASMTVTNVTLLGQPTTFTFVVDPTVTPAMPISVTFDYDDGNTGTVKLAPPYVYTYTYARSVD